MTERRLAVLGLGSNQGDSRMILKGAVSRLEVILEGMRMSSLYATSPQDYIDQPDFINMAVSGYFSGTARELLAAVQAIENDFGRDRQNGVLKGPRTLDIDIELFGNELIDEDRLVVPHESMRNRQFVMIPLLELHPDCADPCTGEPFRTICRKLPDQGVKKAGKLYG